MKDDKNGPPIARVHGKKHFHAQIDTHMHSRLKRMAVELGVPMGTIMERFIRHLAGMGYVERKKLYDKDGIYAELESEHLGAIQDSPGAKQGT